MDRSSSRDVMIHGLDFTSRLRRNDGNDFFANGWERIMRRRDFREGARH